METLKLAVTLMGAVGSLSAVIIFLGKSIINKTLDLGVERYKHTLEQSLETHKAELSKQAEEFKAQLRRLELEHQIKYNKLYEIRAEVIKEIYNKTIDLQTSLAHMTSMWQGEKWAEDEDRENEAKKVHFELINLFKRNRIYFSDTLCDKMDEILDLSKKVIIDMGVTKVRGAYYRTGPESVEILDQWKNTDITVSTNFTSILRELEKEFRLLYGIA